MKTRRRTYTAATPASSKRRRLQSCSGKGDGRSKKNIGLWALIPLDLLLQILSRLGLKANIQASAVCKAWCEAAVSVRKLKPPPLLFYSQDTIPPWGLKFIIPNPLRRFPTCKLRFPGLHFDHKTSYSKDGWVLARQPNISHANTLLLNPFTLESFYLPPTIHKYRDRWLAFSAAPTSANCMVIAYFQLELSPTVVINTWRPGETVWTTHFFENQSHRRSWDKCVFSNGMFYCLSTCGYLGVFHPSKATWDILPVKPCPAFSRRSELHNPVFMTEHKGDIFVIYTRGKSNPAVFVLNSKRKEWEEKTDLGGLTIFTSLPSTVVRAGLSTEHRNRIYSSYIEWTEQYGMYYSIGDAKSSDPPPDNHVTHHLVWVEPPHNKT